MTVRDAISDLPAVVGGAHDFELDYPGPRTKYQKSSRKGLGKKGSKLIWDHYTRPVREDDLEAFRLMDHKTGYADLPHSLTRYSVEIFDDKYKRLHWDGVSRTITAHIAKDGYWYIHPEQHRTLTIREAARIQSFPDKFRFAGTVTQQFRQIGDAVPPLLAEALGVAVFCSMLAMRPTVGSQITKISEAI